MSTVERYHASVRRANHIFRSEAPSIDTETALHMAAKAVNNRVGLNGLIYTLLFYHVLPRPNLQYDPSTPFLYQRAHALRKAMKEVTK